MGGIAGTLATWVVLTAVLSGWGLLLRRSFGLRTLCYEDADTCFWLGLGTVILFLQLWHFLLPIRWPATAAVIALGLAGIGANAGALGAWLRQVRWRRVLPLAGVVLVAASWVADRALLPVTAYDSGMYHIPVIEWTHAFPVVPGLANLHGRLAFNNSSLLFAALVDVGPWAGRSNHVVNGLFLVAILARILVRAFRFPSAHGPDRARSIFDLALLAPIVAMVLRPFFLSSFTTDVAAAVVLLVAVSILFGRLVRREETPGAAAATAFDGFAAMVLLAVAVCFKLSVAVFAVAAWSVGAYLLRRAGRTARGPSGRALGWAIGLCGALALTWLARGVILSGYPAYPSTFAAFPVPWRVPVEQAEAELAWIRHFARTYYRGGIPFAPETVLHWNWLGPWAASLLSNEDANWQVVLPLALVGALPLVSGVGRVWGWGRVSRPAAAGWLLLLPLAVGAAFWFMTAPRPVFGFPLFWLLSALLVAQVLGAWGGGRAAGAPVLVAGLLVGVLPIVREARAALLRGPDPIAQVVRALFVAPGPDHGFHPTPPPELETFVTGSGLRLYVPKDDNRCMDAPLPCTPHPAPNLRLRRPGELGAGFVTDGEWRALRWPSPWNWFLEDWKRYRE